MADIMIFGDSAFSATSLTAALNRVPFRPAFLGSQNLFEPKPVRTVTVAIEQRNGRLKLIQSSERGAPLEQATPGPRDIRDFRTVRLAKGDTLHAYELQNIRAFGTTSELQQVQTEVAMRLQALNDDLELTFEKHRLGAIQGVLLDADGSIIKNWFTEWGITQPAEVSLALANPDLDVRGAIAKIVRAAMKAAQGAWLPGTELHALAGDDFFDALTAHPLVRDTWLHSQEVAELRQGTAFGTFRFGGVTWHNYRGMDDGAVGIAAGEVKFYPVGAPGVFQVAQSPGETFDFVNTLGQRVYAMLVQDKERNAWVKPEVYAYPLHICTAPGMLRRAKLA